MSSIDDLAAVVRAGLDADEQTARLAGAGSWHVECAWEPGECQPGCECRHRRIEGDGEPGITIYDEGGHDEDQADHIVRHDPRRVLADVAAKRALLSEVLSNNAAHWVGCEYLHPNGPCTCGRDARVHAVLTHLAQPYQETT